MNRCRQADRELSELIRTTLAAAADPERAAVEQAYMKSAMPIFGRSAATDLKVLLRPLLAAYRPADRSAWESTIPGSVGCAPRHREERYAAIALAASIGLAGPGRTQECFDLLPWHLIVDRGVVGLRRWGGRTPASAEWWRATGRGDHR